MRCDITDVGQYRGYNVSELRKKYQSLDDIEDVLLEMFQKRATASEDPVFGLLLSPDALSRRQEAELKAKGAGCDHRLVSSYIRTTGRLLEAPLV